MSDEHVLDLAMLEALFGPNWAEHPTVAANPSRFADLVAQADEITDQELAWDLRHDIPSPEEQVILDELFGNGELTDILPSDDELEPEAGLTVDLDFSENLVFMGPMATAFFLDQLSWSCITCRRFFPGVGIAGSRESDCFYCKVW